MRLSSSNKITDIKDDKSEFSGRGSSSTVQKDFIKDPDPNSQDKQGLDELRNIKSVVPNFEQSTAIFAQHFSIIRELRKSVINFKSKI